MEEGITQVNAVRRKYSAAFKARVLRECAEPGASVAGTALAHGINANIVHKWRQKARRGELLGAAATEGFIPVALQRPLQASPAANGGAGQHAAPPDPIQISVQRGAVHLQVVWPVQAAGDCTAWLAAFLR